MGQAKANLSRIIRAQDPICVYCGVSPSIDADHCPPKNIFTSKDRPKGLEFGICKDCHEPTRVIDLIAASYGRMMPPPRTSEEKADIRKYADALKNNAPEVARIFATPGYVNNQGMHVSEVKGDDGIRMHNAMNAFSGRLALALYREKVGRPAGPDLFIHAHYFTSYEIAADLIPPELFTVLRNPKTLRAGRKEKSNQFLHDSYYDPDDDYFTCLALFRESFACLSVISRDLIAAPDQARNGAIYRPGFLKGYDWRKIS